MEIFNSIFFQLTKYQQELNSIISNNIRNIDDDKSLFFTIIVLGLTFFYGAVHAIGPGHGKSIVSSYLLLGKHNYKKSLKLGFLISFFHTLSAILVTVIMYFILEMIVSRSFQEPYNVMVKVSGFFILVSGFYLIYEFFIKKEDSCEGLNLNRKDFAIAFSGGIVPCPGVMSVLFFSIILKKMYIGILATIFMGLGMGITISIFGLLAIYLKGRSIFLNSRIYLVINILSITFIFFIGMFLITS